MGSTFEGMSAAILAPFQIISSTISVALVAAVIPLILLGLSVNISFQGLSILRGVGGRHVFLDLIATNFRTFFVLLVALGAGAGYDQIVGAVTDLQTSLVTASGASWSVSTAPAALDAMITKLADSYALLVKVGFSHLTVSLSSGVDVTGIGMLVEGTIIAGAVVIFASFVFVEVTAVQAAILLVVAIGPLFVAAAAFNATSSYFSGWLNGLLRYSIEVAFLLVLVGVGITILNVYVGHLSSSVSLASGGGASIDAAIDMTGYFLQAIIAAVVLVYLTLKVDSIAASVFGGASISGAAVALAAFAGGAAAKALGAGSSGGGQGAGGGGGGAGGNPLTISEAVEDGMSRALESHGIGRGPGESGTGSITGGGRSGLDTLGAGWMAEFVSRK